MCFDLNGIQLEIDPNPNSLQTNKQQQRYVMKQFMEKKKIKINIKYFALNYNEEIIYQNSWDAAKALLWKLCP